MFSEEKEIRTDTHTQTHTHTQAHTKTTCGHREKIIISKTRKEALEEANSVNTLILDF